MSDDAQATEATENEAEDAKAQDAKAQDATAEDAKADGSDGSDGSDGGGATAAEASSGEPVGTPVEDGASAKAAEKAAAATRDSVLDLARGEVNDEDLDALEQAIESIDFATRKASGDVTARLAALHARLGGLIAEVRDGVRPAMDELPELSEEALQICQNLVDQGIAAGEKGNLEEARGYLEEAVRLSPDGIDAQFNLGVVYGLLAHHNIARAEFYDNYVKDEVFVERAKICYDQVLELVPDHLPSLNNLATLYSIRDERDHAIPLLQRIIGIEPKDDDERTLIASAKSQLEDLESI